MPPVSQKYKQTQNRTQKFKRYKNQSKYKEKVEGNTIHTLCKISDNIGQNIYNFTLSQLF